MVFVSAFAVGHRAPAKDAAGHERPHVILLGIDSLRLDHLQRFGGTGVTKHLDRFLAEADIVRDTTTPVARTFPSWTAILTGRSPSVTGARFNLASREVAQANPTLGDVLREAGYRTIYSTDEVRFANFDETYGFDQVVTPPIGAADFVHRQLQRAAAGVGRCEHAAGPVAVPVLVREPRCGDALPAADLPVAARARGVVRRRSHSLHRASDREPLAVLRLGYAVWRA